jgi:hypothetical protein
MQLVTSALPGGERVESGHAEHPCGEALYVFSGHGSQSATLLAAALYVPGAQAVHTGSQGGSAQARAVYPLLHRHMPPASAPAMDCEFGGHGSMSPPE